MAKHKHHNEIIAWANGAEIEYFDAPWCEWRPETDFLWEDNVQFRVKPEPKPDVVRFVHAYMCGDIGYFPAVVKDNKEEADIKVTFDGETGELKSVEIINKEK